MVTPRLLAAFHRDKFTTIRECNALLIEHLDGRRVAFDAPYHSRRRMLTRLLLDREFLVLDGTATVITELGRDALAAVLAEYADTLVEAHLAAEKAQEPGPQPPEIAREHPPHNFTETI